MTYFAPDHIHNQRYEKYFQPANQNLFDVVHSRLGKTDDSWFTRKILDFGCNVGHLVRTSRGKITSYVGVDVQQPALDIAKRDFPDLTWIHYDGYHPAFNSGGKQMFPDLSDTFDYIFCIGVYTHCDLDSIKSSLDFLKTKLSLNGKIIFSIWEEHHWPLYSRVFLKNKFNIDLPEEVFVPFDRSIYLIDRSYTIPDKNCASLQKCDWIETFFKRSVIENELSACYLDGIYSKHSIFMVQK